MRRKKEHKKRKSKKKTTRNQRAHDVAVSLTENLVVLLRVMRVHKGCKVGLDTVVGKRTPELVKELHVGLLVNEHNLTHKLHQAAEVKGVVLERHGTHEAVLERAQEMEACDVDWLLPGLVDGPLDGLENFVDDVAADIVE